MNFCGSNCSTCSTDRRIWCSSELTVPRALSIKHFAVQPKFYSGLDDYAQVLTIAICVSFILPGLTVAIPLRPSERHILLTDTSGSGSLTRPFGPCAYQQISSPSTACKLEFEVHRRRPNFSAHCTPETPVRTFLDGAWAPYYSSTWLVTALEASMRPSGP